MAKEVKGQEKNQSQNMVDIYIMGKKYTVPDSLTIMKGFEYAGYTLIRGCGCRAGFCGACSTVYRVAGDHELKVGLACQTKVENDMYLTQIPFYPAHKVQYQLDELQGDADQLAEIFPEITKCVGCNACSNVCPQDIKVMKYIAHSIRGEISKAADESFDCLMCGLCATKCPANILQYKVALLSRRLHSRYLVPKAEDLQERIKEIKDGKHEEALQELMNASKEALADQYDNRNIE
ncbi:4Fe-4S dicluster domain-containing protein [Tindallia californiensis]|uniref:4Fe-4S dicluster domain-containing protein n=1 Tax=Tindallia californiensis TaxID=159292 RepID=A0A1H3J2W7_9FIRM|nr:4Fe-4S dicluster domain-containing protein [Tindallia californiensis]SDY33768.1 4Fe-4S dicluster domain-containing protein [Tindallia californiensis]